MTAETFLSLDEIPPMTPQELQGVRDAQERGVQRVYDAIGEVTFSEEQKSNFAECIYEEIGYVIMSASDQRRFNKELKAVIDSAATAKRKIKAYDKKRKKARGNFKSLIACDHLHGRITDDVHLDNVVAYLDGVDKRLKEASQYSFNKGSKTYTSYKTAEFIAEKYLHYFHEMPTTSKYGHVERGNTKSTAFDRVCDLYTNHRINGADVVHISAHVCKALKKAGKVAPQNKK